MIKTVDYFEIHCDNCNERYYNDHFGITAMTDVGNIEDMARDDGWSDTEEGKHYCPKCYEINDEDQLIIKPTQP